MTADPYRGAAPYVNNPANPGSWNKYSYAAGDPVRIFDPTGLCSVGGDPTGGPDPGPTEPPKEGPGIIIVSPSPDECVAPVDPVEGGGDDYQAYLNLLTATILKPAVDQSVALLRDNPGCAGLFGNIFGNMAVDPADTLQSTFDAGNIRWYAFDDSISPGVGAQTTAPLIQIATNRYFVTGILADGTSLTNPPPGTITGFQGLTMDEARDVILIHELLHLTGVVGDDDNNQSITLPTGQTVVGSAGVTAAVRQDCIEH